MALTALREIAACELLTARQAWWLRQQVSGQDPAPGLAAVAALLADTVPPVREDRPLGDDVARIDDLLRNDGLGTGQPGPDTPR
jgi:histidine ammonia-lyase